MTMISLNQRAVALAAAAVLVFGIGAYAGAASPTAVTIENFAFAPAPLTVAPGTTVTWTNKDEEPHTVLSADGGMTFKSQALDTDDKFSFTFAKAGTYKYFCSIHPHMVGTVVVQ
jgi:plastocyanin